MSAVKCRVCREADCKTPDNHGLRATKKKREKNYYIAQKTPAEPNTLQGWGALILKPPVEIKLDDVTGGLKIIRKLIINSAEMFEAAIQMTAEVKAERARREAIRKSIVDPINAGLKQANAVFKPGDNMFAEAERILKAKLVAYTEKQEAARTALLLEAEAQGQEGEHEAASESIAQIAATVVPKVGNYSQSVQWTGEVVDVSKLPREYLIPDVSRLQAITKARKGDPQIPGWRAWPKTVSIVRQPPGGDLS